jgi:hypothetical protein
MGSKIAGGGWQIYSMGEILEFKGRNGSHASHLHVLVLVRY